MDPKHATYKKLVCRKLSTDFREAVAIETVNMCHPKKGEICVKNKFVGINASDVNITKGIYFGDGKVPFDIGFEAVGEVVAVGDDVKNFTLGQNVAYMSSKLGAYSEYCCLETKAAFPVPEAKPDYLVLLASGLTAAIGLDKAGRITEEDTVLITAAAGGTGHIAVQWAKAAGCKVIGTCSTADKKKVLKELGCDRVINYKTEDFAEVLSKEYPKGVSVIWETIGGKVFETCLKNLGEKGRLLIIGGTSSYKSESEKAIGNVDISYAPQILLAKSAALQGFLLLHFSECFETYFKHLKERIEKGELKAVIDTGEDTTGTEFVGMEGVIRGVEHLHSGKNIGKVVARVS
ncbi:prostaglandin reductase 3-like isoform X1 [Stegodyphus dumicola]|uniref:prostaglandin reductase 3-like isoform X1 n=1 Tax=Stegodyphus dumicola TaxID=202533 RepID=UPI0015ADBE8C|nr:prostaglandin reductase 3-like isoform X1 [Stegodyphus dumicola]